MSLETGKAEFIELVKKLYICLFLPASSTRPNDPKLSGLIVPDKDRIIQQTIKAIHDLDKQTFNIRGHQSRDVRRVIHDAEFILYNKNEDISKQAWIATCAHYEVDMFILNLVEQLLVTFNQEYRLSDNFVAELPVLNISDLTLTPKHKIPSEGKNGEVIKIKSFKSVPPYWRWFYAVLPRLEEADKHSITKNTTLETILAGLCVPCFPVIKKNSFNRSVELPLNNAMRMTVLLNRVAPIHNEHDNAVRKIMAINFVTFGYKNIRVLGSSLSGSGDSPLASLSEKINYAKSYIRKEADRVGTLYDKHFQQDHVYGVGVEDLLSGIDNLVPESSPAYDDPTLSAIKRAVDEVDPDEDDDAHDSNSDVPLAPPGQYSAPGQYGGSYGAEKLDDPEEGDENAEVSEEDPEDVDNVNQGNPDDSNPDDPTDEEMGIPSGPDDNQEDDPNAGQSDVGEQQQNGDKEDQNKIDPTYKKIYKGKPIKVGSDSNVSTYMYRMAVANLNAALQDDPGPAVGRETKDLLNQWCLDWLWIADIKETQKLLENKGLMKFFRA